MAIITLTTDLGTKDHYVGVLKGTIYSSCPEVHIVDISHEIPTYNILKAAFTIKNCYKAFPKGTIHLIGVNPEIGESSSYLALEVDNQFFIGADNGIFSLIFEEKPSRIFNLDISQDPDDLTFPTKNIFAKAACHLAKGGTLEMIGKKVDYWEEKSFFRAVSVGNIIKGMAIHVDHYGNIITNIEEPFFKAFSQGRDFAIEFHKGDYDIKTISKFYSDVAEGEKLALFSSSGFLEIAMNKGNASKLLGIKESDTIRVEIYDR